MFIITARIPKRRLIGGLATLGCCAAALIAALLLTAGDPVSAAAEVPGMRQEDARIGWLNSRGITVEPQPLRTEELLIPEQFDDRYGDYLALQREQGFEPERYAGRRVTRITYRITNDPEGRRDLSAALLLFKGRIVGGQIQSDDGSILRPLITAQEKN